MRAAHVEVWCVSLAEYRLDDLARISGVSSRNIRAYRERGLLDPPRREGRSAYYDDYHLSQLKTINELLRKGFNSSHIAEFFARMREGHDLAAILGVQQAILGHRPAEAAPPAPATASTAAIDTIALNLDPGCEEAQRLMLSGLAELSDDTVVLVDAGMAAIVTRTADQLHYIQAILRMFDSTSGTIDELAAVLVAALEECVDARYGPGFIPKPEELAEVSRLVQDYRDLGSAIVTRHLDKALQQHMVSAVSEYTTGMVVSGQWEANSSPPSVTP
ncbi:MAG: MerR family transcriptional regulator [Mycobacterium sp.]